MDKYCLNLIFMLKVIVYIKLIKFGSFFSVKRKQSVSCRNFPGKRESSQSV